MTLGGWYTPDLSTDFLELPPPPRKGGMWRFFYLRWSVA